VRPILQAYHGKDIPLEYAKKEAEAKAKHIEEWKAGKVVTGGSLTLSGLFANTVRHYPTNQLSFHLTTTFRALLLRLFR
jgi:hypothetical protein